MDKALFWMFAIALGVSILCDVVRTAMTVCMVWG